MSHTDTSSATTDDCGAGTVSENCIEPARAFRDPKTVALAWAVTYYQPQQIVDRDTGSLRWVPGWSPKPATCYPENLVSMLTTFREVESKEQAPAWSPVLLVGHRRRNANVQWVSCAVLDVDDGVPMEVVSSRFSKYVRIWHTSWSHTDHYHKGRLVLPLAAPVPVHYWPRAWAKIQAMAGQHMDEQAKDASRVYFVPACRPGERDRHDCGYDAAGGTLLDLRPFQHLPLTEAEREAQEARRRRQMAPRKQWRPSRGSETDEEQRRLKEDPDARRAHGEKLGGRIRPDRVTDVPCPGCGKRSVWWPFQPKKTPKAMCNHRNSCGWTGFLDELK